MRFTRFIFAILLFTTATICHAEEIKLGKFHALIIGNNNYKGEFGVWHNLNTPGENAESLAEVLRDKFGFDNIELVRNASKKELIYSFENLRGKLQKNDSVLVYYAGHAKKIGSNVYWIPVDAKGEDNGTYVNTKQIRDLIAELSSAAAHIFLISDAPFNKELVEELPNPGGQLSVNRKFLPQLSVAKSAQALIQKGSSYVDQDFRDSGLTPLTYHIIESLKNTQADILTFEELSNSAYRNLGKGTQKQIEYGVIKGADDDTGEFLFVLNREAGKPVQTEKAKPKRKVYSASLFNKRPILPIAHF